MAHDAESIGVAQAVDEISCLAGVILIIDDGRNLPNIRVDGKPQDNHLDQGNQQCKDKGRGVAPQVANLFIDNRVKTPKRVTHQR